MPDPALITEADVVGGLDTLQTEVPVCRTRYGGRVFPVLGAVVAIVLLWQALSGMRYAQVPTPLAVWDSLAGMVGDGSAGWALATSVGRGAVGFAAAALSGTLLGLAVALNAGLRSAVGPLLLALQTLPSVAWAPLALLLFRHGDAALYAIVVAGATPAIATGLMAGLDQVPPLLRRAGRSIGARRWSLARFVLLPGAAPGYLAGLKHGWAFSWRALMAAELVVGAFAGHPGLGQLLSQTQRRGDVADLLAVVLLILLVGLVVELGVFAPLERRVLARRGLTGAHR